MQSQRTNSRADGGEREILREIRRRVGRVGQGSLRLGIGDDCALLGVRAGEDVAVTTDLSIAGRHFRLDWHPPESIGHRTLARGLSDLAAMGARPLAAFLSLGIPGALTLAKGRGRPWVDRFYDGLLRLAQAHKTPLAGGDLAESPVALADIVLVGAVPAGRALRRSGARPGDILYVTGRLGGAAAGLAKLKASGGKLKGGADPARLSGTLTAHLYPQPRLAQGLALQRKGIASAAIDLSDGLSTDLGHLCQESGVGAVIHGDKLPIAEGAIPEQAMHGGEDYELLFSVRPSVRVPHSIAGVSITRIGYVTKLSPGQPSILLTQGGATLPLKSRGWEHFTS